MMHTAAVVVKGERTSLRTDIAAILVHRAETIDDELHAAEPYLAPPPAPMMPAWALVAANEGASHDRVVIDVGGLFGDDVGKEEGLEVFVIDHFEPVALELTDFGGRLCEGDCFIFLQTTRTTTTTATEENGAAASKLSNIRRERHSANKSPTGLTCTVFYWLGKEASIDKIVAAAVMSVHLKNFVGSFDSVRREAQGEESDEFRAMYPWSINYTSSETATPSGLMDVQSLPKKTRLFKMVHVSFSRRRLEMIELDSANLRSDMAFVLETPSELIAWTGKRANLSTKANIRFLADRLNNGDHHGSFPISYVEDGDENDDVNRFWSHFEEGKRTACDILSTDDPDIADTEPTHSTFYRVSEGDEGLGVEEIECELVQKCLERDGCYVIDCYVHVFLWIGEESSMSLRKRAFKLAKHFFQAMDRPPGAELVRLVDGGEPEIFKMYFNDWNKILSVDHSLLSGMSSSSLHRKKEIDIKMEIDALLTPPHRAMNMEEATQYIAESNRSLKQMEMFVIEGKTIVRLPPEERGVFYSGECYIFWCTYVVNKSLMKLQTAGDEEPTARDDLRARREVDGIETVLYFWEGRNAPSIGWLQFKFRFQRRMQAMVEEMTGGELHIERLHQQHESMRFLSHFSEGIVIHKGLRSQFKHVQKAAGIDFEVPSRPSDSARNKLAAKQNTTSGVKRIMSPTSPTSPTLPTFPAFPAAQQQQQQQPSFSSSSQSSSQSLKQPSREQKSVAAIALGVDSDNSNDAHSMGAGAERKRLTAADERLPFGGLSIKKIEKQVKDAGEELGAVQTVYHVHRGIHPTFKMAVQVALDPRVLVSGDCFLLFDPVRGDVFLWVGRGSLEQEKNIALELKNTLDQNQVGFRERASVFGNAMKRKRKVQTVEEGKESGTFWSLLSGNAYYTYSPPLGRNSVAPAIPRLFHCSNENGYFRV